MQQSYRTVKKGLVLEAEFVDRKSRFIAHLTHVESVQETDLFIDQIKRRYHDARHNVPAWILASGQKRCSDDGEPQRTAGLPELEVLEGTGLKDVCVVVTRYFGGTLLGPGGLIRAYTQVTQDVIEEGRRQEGLVRMDGIVSVALHLTYPFYDKVLHLVEQYQGKVSASDFSDVVDLTLVFLEGDEKSFLDEVDELTAKSCAYQVSEPHFGQF